MNHAVHELVCEPPSFANGREHINLILYTTINHPINYQILPKEKEKKAPASSKYEK